MTVASGSWTMGLTAEKNRGATQLRQRPQSASGADATGLL